jgi:hypothetical protein
MTSVGYWIDLDSIQLSDGDAPSSWIQAMTVGKYDHPIFGEIDFTPERIKRFADNVNTRVRGIDPDIDYDHKATTSEAAGWIKKAEVRNNGLWVFVEWTKDAASKIRNKAYKYFSPEFVDEWKHPSSGQTFKDVLFGGGITNRPFLKDILPLNLSELFSEEHGKQNQGGNEMDRKKLCELLGLPEGSSDDAIAAAIKQFRETSSKPNDTDPQLVQLAESNPVIKAMLERQANTEKRLAETETALRLSEVTSSIAKLSEGKSWTLPAVVLNELPAALVQMPKTLSDSVTGILGKLIETGLVPLSEIGHQRGGGQNEIDPVKKFTDKVAEIMKGNDKLDYSSAVSHVALTEPQLFNEYRKSSYAGREN